MDFVKIMETFPTQEHCLVYLERLRWQGNSTGYTPVYLAEACYKYNHRETNMFEKFLKEIFNECC